MIPRKIHYCWFGHGEMPQITKDCIDSWHKYMPDWEYKLWNEDNFDVNRILYTKEAYKAKKYAFVSDYVRLIALLNEGGVYLDTDVEVFKSFDDLLSNIAFAGFEGSKYLPVGTCIMASQPHTEWIKEQLDAYNRRKFLLANGTYDTTTNVQLMSRIMQANGFVQDGKEQFYKNVHIYPVDYFSPRHTTGEYIRTQRTYCDHLGLGSWSDSKNNWKSMIKYLIGQKRLVRLIKLKRKIVG